MADSKISALTAHSGAPATGDLVPIVDISDTTDAATGTTKKLTVTNLFTSPVLTTPNIGVATATSVNKVAITAPASGSTLTIIDGKTLTANKTMSLTAADDTGVYTFPTGTKTLLATDGAGTSLTGIPYTLTGTANQITLSAGTGNITLSLPQSIATSSNPQFATLELGNASDTTLSRSAAGVLAVEGIVIPSISSTNTLTNKAITKRVVTTTDDTTAVIDVTITDDYELSAIANNTTFSTTGSPTDGQVLVIRWKDAGVSKTLTWDAIFVAVGVTLPAATTAGKWQYVGCKYNSGAAKFHAIAVATQA